MNSLPRKKTKLNFDEEFGNSDDVKTDIEEREQVLLVLIEHHTKDVERNKWRLSYFTSEVD